MPAIYLDNNATTRPAPAVLQAMHTCQTRNFGNASSVHALGQAARHAVETAREQLAALIQARARDVAWTSGGTESDRVAIAGLCRATPQKRRIVTTAVEHAAVRDYLRQLESDGFEIVRIPVNASGDLDLTAFAEALNNETALASVMLANNETGVIFPIREIAELTGECGVPLHVDAIQAAGRMPIDVNSLGAQLVSLSAHKMHGIKGAGALWFSEGTRFVCPFSGARSAPFLRSGTENVPAIVGFGAAAQLAIEQMSDMLRVAELRDMLENAIVARCDKAAIAGRRETRIANTTTICFDGLEAEAIVIGLSERNVYVSSGSACSSGSIEPSHVLQAMDLPPGHTRGAIRFSLSRETTREEIAETIEHVCDVVGRLAAFAG